MIDLWNGSVPLVDQTATPFVMTVEPEVEFFAGGRAAPQGSKSYLGVTKPKDGSKGKPMAKESSVHLPAWRAAVKSSGQLAMDGRDPLAGDLAVGFRFTFVRPASHFKVDGVSLNATGQRALFPKGPDLSKLIRGVEDSLNEVVWMDDKQIAVMDPPACRVWGDRSGVHVVVRRLW